MMNIQLDLSKSIKVCKNNPIHIIVCCSGGVDSMALLDMAYHYIHDQQAHKERHERTDLLDKSNIQLSVFHVKHGMSEYQNDWSELVERYSKSLGLDVYITDVNPDRSKLTETDARKRRYAALDEYIQILDKQLSSNPQDVLHTQGTQGTKGTQFIVLTGHHKNDRLENFLISIFKNRVHNFDLVNHVAYGNHSNGRVFFQKPFLDIGVTKEDLIHYCQSKNIEYVEDESNVISDNLRNIFRNQLFPFIEKLKNPKQYFTSLESFFDSYKVFHDFYILSVKDLKNKMMVKKLDDGMRYSCSLDLIRGKTGCSSLINKKDFNEVTIVNEVNTIQDLKGGDFSDYESYLDLDNQSDFKCLDDNNQLKDNQQFYEFIGYLVLLFVNGDSNNNPVEVTYNNAVNEVNAVKYKFNQKDFVKKLPVLIKNESRYIVNEKVSVWIKNGNLFIKVKG